MRLWTIVGVPGASVSKCHAWYFNDGAGFRYDGEGGSYPQTTRMLFTISTVNTRGCG